MRACGSWRRAGRQQRGLQPRIRRQERGSIDQLPALQLRQARIGKRSDEWLDDSRVAAARQREDQLRIAAVLPRFPHGLAAAVDPCQRQCGRRWVGEHGTGRRQRHGLRRCRERSGDRRSDPRLRVGRELREDGQGRRGADVAEELDRRLALAELERRFERDLGQRADDDILRAHAPEQRLSRDDAFLWRASTVGQHRALMRNLRLLETERGDLLLELGDTPFDQGAKRAVPSGPERLRAVVPGFPLPVGVHDERVQVGRVPIHATRDLEDVTEVAGLLVPALGVIAQPCEKVRTLLDTGVEEGVGIRIGRFVHHLRRQADDHQPVAVPDPIDRRRVAQAGGRRSEFAPHDPEERQGFGSVGDRQKRPVRGRQLRAEPLLERLDLGLARRRQQDRLRTRRRSLPRRAPPNAGSTRRGRRSLRDTGHPSIDPTRAGGGRTPRGVIRPGAGSAGRTSSPALRRRSGRAASRTDRTALPRARRRGTRPASSRRRRRGAHSRGASSPGARAPCAGRCGSRGAAGRARRSSRLPATRSGCSRLCQSASST